MASAGRAAYAKLIFSTHEFYIEDVSVVLGRASKDTDPNNKRFCVAGNAKTISRQHVTIDWDGSGKWFLTCHSNNSVWINLDKEVAHNKRAELNHMDRITLGGVLCYFLLPTVAGAPVVADPSAYVAPPVMDAAPAVTDAAAAAPAAPVPAPAAVPASGFAMTDADPAMAEG